MSDNPFAFCDGKAYPEFQIRETLMDDEEIVFILPVPKPEFRTMSEEEIQTAIHNRNRRKSRKVIAEISRLVDEYIANFKIYVARNGAAPFLLEVQVRCPIEKMAVRLMMAALEADKSLTRSTSTLH